MAMTRAKASQITTNLAIYRLIALALLTFWSVVVGGCYAITQHT